MSCAAESERTRFLGVDYTNAAGNPRWTLVLDQIAEAGYRWTELGPLGYLPVDPTALRAELDERQLRLSAGFIFDAFTIARSDPD